MKHFFWFLLFLTLVPTATAQTVLTLRQAIERAQTNSPAVEIARLDFEQSQWTYRSFRTEYLPALSLTGNAPGMQRSIEEIVQDDGTVRYVEQNQMVGRANLAVSQPLPMTGGQLFVTSGLSRVDNTFGDNSIVQWQSAPLLIGLSQPILQFNEMKWRRRIEPLRHDLARRSYIEALENIALDVSNRFFDVYLAQMNIDIAAANVAVNDTIFALAQGRFDIGTIAENDLLQSELALLNAQSDLSDAQIAYQENLQALKLALDLPYDADLTIIPPTTVPSLRIDPEEAVVQARIHRPAFLDLEIQKVEAEQDVVRTRRLNSFSADLTASYGLNQSAPAFDGAYRDPLNSQRFTINFSVPIFRWGRGRADVEAALTRQERVEHDAALQRKELEQDVYFQALRLDQLQQQVIIAAKADTVGTRRFEVAKNRYLIGKIDVTELFNAQREKDQARRAYIQAIRQFWTAYFNLRRLTLYDFTRNQPLTGRFE